MELTLRPRKKISSILNHLVSKWGSSSAALGEPVLFPYRIQDTVSTNRRWTLNDDETSAGDVYAAIGNPEVFRLRYKLIHFSCSKGCVIQAEIGIL